MSPLENYLLRLCFIKSTKEKGTVSLERNLICERKEWNVPLAEYYS